MGKGGRRPRSGGRRALIKYFTANRERAKTVLHAGPTPFSEITDFGTMAGGGGCPLGSRRRDWRSCCALLRELSKDKSKWDESRLVSHVRDPADRDQRPGRARPSGEDVEGRQRAVLHGSGRCLVRQRAVSEQLRSTQIASAVDAFVAARAPGEVRPWCPTATLSSKLEASNVYASPQHFTMLNFDCHVDYEGVAH